MDIQPFLQSSSARHNHLCPHQVLGVRIGLLAAKIYGMPPGVSPGKRLLALVESDRCFSDGVEVATGCTLGHRRLRLEDYGKIAASFVDLETGRAVRIAPHPNVRQRAADCQPQESRRYFAQLQAYQVIPDEELLSVEEILLNTPPGETVSSPVVCATCDLCGEKIINERELTRASRTLCRVCAGEGYYRPVAAAALVEEK